MLAAHFAEMLEAIPIGLLLLDWDLRALWYNSEGAYVCAVWNHGERRASALNPRRNFRVPAALAQACGRIREDWEERARSGAAPPGRPAILSEDGRGLYAHIVPRPAPPGSARPPAFVVQLDYRRPRGDRNRPLSAGALALLGRLSAREREVAMGIREGLRTAQIAGELCRSPLTIKTQLNSIYAKLGAQGRAAVAALLNR